MSPTTRVDVERVVQRATRRRLVTEAVARIAVVDRAERFYVSAETDEPALSLSRDQRVAERL